MTITCTITKAGRSDEYGRPLLVGQSYTGVDSFVKSLYMAGYCSVTNISVFDDDDHPYGAPMPNVTAVVDRETNEVTLLFDTNEERLYVETEEQYLLPPTSVSITASQGVVGKSCGLTSVKCITGTTITITVYDNATVAAGTVLFTQVMSAGDEMVFPKPIQAINGIWVVLGGASTFYIGVQDVI